MTIAIKILAASQNSLDAMIQAELLTNNVSQNWENESTVFTFEDGSVLTFHNSDVVRWQCFNFPELKRCCIQ